jgi:hypothetical protein
MCVEQLVAANICAKMMLSLSLFVFVFFLFKIVDTVDIVLVLYFREKKSLLI